MMPNPASDRHSICLVEDDPMWQQAVAALLGMRDDLALMGIRDNYNEGLDMIRETQPELLLLDFQIKGNKSGLDIAHAMAAQGFPEHRIILVSSTPASVIGPNPYGYVPKTRVAHELLQAIDEALLQPSPSA